MQPIRVFALLMENVLPRISVYVILDGRDQIVPPCIAMIVMTVMVVESVLHQILANAERMNGREYHARFQSALE